MTFDVKWIVIVLLVIAIIVTAAIHLPRRQVEPEVTPTPTVEVIDIMPTPEPSSDIGDLITPDPSPTNVIVVEITEAEKNAAFEKYSRSFADQLLADGDDTIEISIDSATRSFVIVYTLTDEDVRDFAVAMAADKTLTYNDMISTMIDADTLNEFKNVMFCNHLIIALKNDGQIFAAYDIISQTEQSDMIERVG